MMFRKVYGQSRTEDCLFCGKRALSVNSQGVPVCTEHKSSLLPEMKCACGSWLEIKNGKFGPFFTCISCGCISLKKALEVNPKPLPVDADAKKALSDDSRKPTYSRQDPGTRPEKQENAKAQYKAVKESKKEITLTSDELDFYF